MFTSGLGAIMKDIKKKTLGPAYYAKPRFFATHLGLFAAPSTFAKRYKANKISIRVSYFG
jgi:hypothetical protein